MSHLPEEAVAALEKAYRLEKEPRAKVRFHALWLVSRRYRQKHTAAIIGRSALTIREWVTAYLGQGLDGIRAKPQTGNHRLLTDDQKHAIGRLIRDKTPTQVGLRGDFWNIPTLKQLVKRDYNVRYQHPEAYRRLLRFCGLTYHQPAKVNRKQNPHLVRRFEDKLKKDSTGMPVKMVWYW